MPLYEIEHVCPINPHQQQAIADSIVKIHSEIYTTPSLFVNVRFKDANDTPLLVAGKRVSNLSWKRRLFSLLPSLGSTKVVRASYSSILQLWIILTKIY
jgi:hypothetical protein